MGVIHQGQGLTLGLEPGQDLLGIHAQLDDLQGDLARDRLGLLGQVDRGEPTLPDHFADLVAVDLLADGQFRG